ncbi:hypothetical protein M3223_01320 [Paenibacillus pasadenensis]|uniref:hypothetical protein n=1 Tax=Paenibacillus pasadenensis TaxID=217090 RepID=UPI00203DA297|nr:hypothetical protein [Paenibacillus pasadenensis]MCM3745986.1 hypothetical protein [Paenibacillus pasadenensis]
MVGNWRINAWLAAGGALLTLLLNAGRNPWPVAGMRLLAAAAAFWLLAYALRFLLTFTLPERPLEQPSDEEAAPGSTLDLQADGGENLEALIREGWKPPALSAEDNPQPETARTAAASSAFQPLSPPQLRASRPELQEQDLVQAVRHLNREE